MVGFRDVGCFHVDKLHQRWGQIESLFCVREINPQWIDLGLKEKVYKKLF